MDFTCPTLTCRDKFVPAFFFWYRQITDLKGNITASQVYLDPRLSLTCLKLSFRAFPNFLRNLPTLRQLHH